MTTYSLTGNARSPLHAEPAKSERQQLWATLLSWMETYIIPEAAMEEFIGAGMWIGHEFEWNGRQMVVISIGQRRMENGRPVVPLDVQELGMEGVGSRLSDGRV